MHVSKRLSSLLVVPALLGLAVAGTRASAPAQPAQAAMALVKMSPAQILTTEKGLALYIYSPDKPNKSVCTGQCATYWPAMTVPMGAKVPATMTGIKGKFGVTMRADGTQQLTYDGAPLYTFVKDKDAGDLYGEGVGGIWWAVVVSRPEPTSAS